MVIFLFYFLQAKLEALTELMEVDGGGSSVRRQYRARLSLTIPATPTAKVSSVRRQYRA
jgi:hypothetical protein